MAQFKGQIIVPDFGFCGRDAHTNLIRANRLIAEVNTLSEVPVTLRQTLLTIPDRSRRGRRTGRKNPGRFTPD